MRIESHKSIWETQEVWAEILSLNLQIKQPDLIKNNAKDYWNWNHKGDTLITFI